MSTEFLPLVKVAYDTTITVDVAMVVTALTGGVGVLMGAWFARRKAEAEAKRILAEAAQIDANADSVTLASAAQMMTRMSQELEKLRLRVDMLENEIKVERARTEEVRGKYAGALERIVDLERKLAEAEKRIAWQAAEIKTLTDAREGFDG